MSENNQNNISNDYSELFHEINQKEININKRTSTGTKKNDKSNDIYNESKPLINNFPNLENITENKILNSLNNNESKKIPTKSFNEQINNNENEFISENEFKNSNSKEDDFSELIHEITQKEINNNKTFTGSKIYNKSNETKSNETKSNEIDNSGK